MRIGLGMYDALAGRRGIGATRWLSSAETQRRLPGVRAGGLQGGVAYWDGQFDDARLAIALMRTAVGLGATVVNYIRVEKIGLEADRVRDVLAVDDESGERFELRAKAVFNAAGVWVDAVRRLADARAAPLVTVSRGSHIVLDRRFMPGESGLMIPKTPDGRVLFGIPWHDRLIVGTTDVPVEGPAWDPKPSESEIEFILETARGYLSSPPSRADVLSAFAGLRPLFSPGAHGSTKTISREHAIVIEHGNLLTVTGGKWTTYRRMALDALAQASRRGLLDERPCTTENLRLAIDPALEKAHRSAESSAARGDALGVQAYLRLAVEREQARRPEDLLARRLRVGLLQDGLMERLVPAATAALSAK
jgi:glycerol-3-phosphate dehydrogenase